MKIIIYLLSFLLIFTSPALYAQEKDTTGESMEEPVKEEPVKEETPAAVDKKDEKKSIAEKKAKEAGIVVTATRTAQRLEDVPGRAALLTSAQITGMNVSRIDEIFRLVSGINDQRTTGIFASSSSVSFRGLGSEGGRSLVLMDGVPLNKGETGETNWNRIDIRNIERIEVFKGPASSLYGNNSMGGVINLISKVPKNPYEGRASLSYGTFDTKSASLGLSGRPSGELYNGLFWSLSGFHNDSDGYVSATPQKAVENAKKNVVSQKNYIDETSVTAKAGYDFNKKNGLAFSYTNYNDRRSESSRVLLDGGSYRDYDTNAAQLSYRGGTDDFDWHVDAFYNREDYSRRVESLKGSNYDKYTLMYADCERDDYGVYYSLSTHLIKYNTLTIGGDVKEGCQNSLDHTPITSNAATDTRVKAKGKLLLYSIYLQDELSLLNDRWKVLGGLRVDWAYLHNGYYENPDMPLAQFNGRLKKNRWWHVSPRISSRFTFAEWMSAYASYSQGFRASILDDLVRAGVMWGLYKEQNPDLRPEVLDNYEAGMDFKPLEDLSFSVTGFYSVGTDFLYYVKTGRTIVVGASTKDLYKRDNVGRVLIHGAEADVKYLLLKGLSIFANYTYTISKIDNYNERKDLEDKYLSYSPKHQASAGLEWLNPYLNVNTVFNYKGSYYTDDTNTRELWISGYYTFDVNLWIKVGDWFGIGDHGSFFVKVQNVLNNRFINGKETATSSPVYSYRNSSRAPGRMITVGLEAKL